MTAIDHRREAAIERLREKRDYRRHVAVYVLVNLLLVVIWAASGGGYFWPVWPIAGWGFGLAIKGYTVYFQEADITEDEIQAEMDRQGEPHGTPGL